MLVDRRIHPEERIQRRTVVWFVGAVLLAIFIIIGVVVFIAIAISLWRTLRSDEELEPAGTWGTSLKSDDPPPGDSGSE
jgi:hypothetical protein